MKSFLIIGMGRFGRHLCMKLCELGNEVMIVDRDEGMLEGLLSMATNAQVGDGTKVEMLRTLGVGNFDVCFVCMGSDFQSNLEITSQLKELGARYVISKAARDLHAKFLLRNGADEIVYPEKDIAEKLAVRVSANHLFDYLQLSPEISIYEIAVADSWVGKSIREMNFRVKYRASILATKEGDTVFPMPSPDHVFTEREHLMIMGKHADVEKLLKFPSR